MSKSNLPSDRVLILRSADDVGFASVLGSLLPGAEIQARAFALADWLRTLRDTPLQGLVVESNHLDLADLRLIEAGLESLGADRPWLILLVGDRGLVGCESLLAGPNTALLPQPWTPQALKTVLEQAQGGSAPSSGGFSEPFLDGLVEGLRDPLTSISGYLQLLEHQDDEAIRPLVLPAMQAAGQIAEQLEALHLAAATRQAHVGPVDLHSVLEDFVTQAGTQGQRVDFDLPESTEDAPSANRIEADVRLLKACLRSGLLLLSRFGPGGPLRLRLSPQDAGLRLSLGSEVVQEDAEAVQEPPAYLEDLFRRLASRVPAQAWVDKAQGRMPLRLGLVWP